MAGAAQVALVWSEWGIQAMVLLSFTLQVVLLILAEFRRRVDSGVLRFFTWSAYQMADSVAIYVLSHMAVTGRSPEHELVAFWAPFLLMHLGGQDNITAYAIEDNELWLRHLQTLAVQVAAAAYVLYASTIFSSSHHSLLLQLATILMFIVGVVKYGERVWALRYASSSASAGNNYKRNSALQGIRTKEILSSSRASRSDAEDIVFLGHEILDIPKELLKGSVLRYYVFLIYVIYPKDSVAVPLHLDDEEAYKVAEVQVSLMRDIYYTKAESQCGVIRLVSSMATAIALLLLLLLLSGSGSHDGYKKVDVAITCVLSVGAGVVEAVSLLRYILSSYNWHRYETGKQERGLLARVLMSLRRLIHASERRIKHGWSRSMGQHNLLQVCGWSKTSRSSKMARRLGLEDWWNTLVCSSSVPVSPLIELLLVKQVRKSYGVDDESPDHILNSRGRAVLKRKSQQLYDELYRSLDPDKLSLEATILVWHIATDLYLRWYKEQMASTSSCRLQDDLAKAVEALSNYMLFLLAARPNMLPPSASRNAYVEVCDQLMSSSGLEYTSAEDLAHFLRRYGDALNNPGSYMGEFPVYVDTNLSTEFEWDTVLKRGSQLATELIRKESQDSPASDLLELIGKVWVEMLCYLGSRCSAHSHIKQLSDGGELITVAAFLVEYLKIQHLFSASRSPADRVLWAH